MERTKLLRTLLSFSLLGTTISAATGLPTLGLSSYAPIPTAALGPPVPRSPGYRVQHFGDGAYMVTDGLYQAMFLVSCESVIVVDSPPSIGYNITFVAHRQTADLLAMTPDKHRPAPSVTFQDSYNLRVCNQSLELNYMGANHEAGNIFIWAPLHKILMLVDIVYPGWVPYYELGVAQNIPGYVKAHKQILTYDFEHFIGGHLDRTGTREDVLISQAYVADLFDACVQAMHLSTDPNSTLYAPAIQGAVAEAEPGNSWLVVDTTINILAGYANNVTNEKWKGKLVGLDVYGRSNAAAMYETVLIDWGINGAFGVTNGPA